jgi:(S)-ureidoglycine aminohydrolase
LSYTLVTPANHYPSRLPPFGDAPVVKLVTPRMKPSRIGQYLVSLPAGAGTGRAVEQGWETFLYALEGEAAVLSGGDVLPLHAGGFVYLPGDDVYEIAAGERPARLLIVKRRYEPFPDLPAPRALAGHRDDEPFQDTDVPGFRRRELLPTTDPAFDFNMSLLAFEAGVGLDKIEIHDEEHGLYMTAGGGTYLLEDRRFEVQAGDFIYMAPYCPQSFVAGDEPAEYLLYKDVWRDGF